MEKLPYAAELETLPDGALSSQYKFTVGNTYRVLGGVNCLYVVETDEPGETTLINSSRFSRTLSERQYIAEQLVGIARELNLLEVYASGDVLPTSRRDGKGVAFYSFSICRARSVDGYVRVYSPNHINVKYETAIRMLPRWENSAVCSLEDAKELLVERFRYYRA